MLPKDTLQLMLDAARASSDVPVIHPSHEPAHVYYMFNPISGALQQHEAKTKPRNHSADTLESFCEFTKREANKDESGDPTVWLGRELAVAVLDDATTRRNQCLWQIPYSERWKLLNEKVLGKEFNQVDFCRLLRVTLRGIVPAAIMPIVQSLKLEQGRVMVGEASQFKDTSSTETRRQVSGVDNLPEVVRVSCPILQGDSPTELDCSIEVSLDSGKLSLVAYPDEIESGLVARFRDLRTQIAEQAGCSVFLGTA